MREAGCGFAGRRGPGPGFQAIADPTHGTVTYVDAARARSAGLLSVDPATGHARLANESSRIATGSGRASVRLRSRDSFHEGLFGIDVHHLPEGNAVWPAFWMVLARSCK